MNFGFGRTGLRLVCAGLLITSLNGCVLALAAPLVTAAGISAVTNSTVDKTQSYAVRVTRLNCRQLRAEFAKLQKNKLGRVSPLGGWASKRAAVRSVAGQKGCRL